MKTSVAVALIICGTLLLIAPQLTTSIGTAQVTKAMIELSKDVSLKGNLPRWYDSACVILGAAMILIGIIGALKKE